MKNIFGKFILTLLTFGLALTSVSTVYLYIEYTNAKNKIQDYEIAKFEKLNFVENVDKNFITEYSAIQKVEKKPKDISKLQLSGWIPDWDFQDGFATLQEYGNKFNSVSPFWYLVDESGNITKTAVADDFNFINYTKSEGIQIIPTVTNFDPLIMSKVLKNDETIQTHVDYIVAEVINNDFDGIDLDYESIYLKDKEKFFKLLQKISAEMIKNDKKFIFTVLPKWGNDVVYSGLQETRLVQDYKRIADLVDELRIMTYEYTGRNPNEYGPNAPLQWVEDVIKYAILVGVPRDKIVLGIPTYSYEYSVATEMKNLNYYPVMKIEKGKADGFAYYNNLVQKVKADRVGEDSFNEKWGEAVYKFVRDGKESVMVYQTDKSIELRKKLAAEYGLRGLAYWRLGDEDGLKL